MLETYTCYGCVCKIQKRKKYRVKFHLYTAAAYCIDIIIDHDIINNNSSSFIFSSQLKLYKHVWEQ